VDADGHDERWMRRALALADRGRYTVSPNPLVGCVVVRDGVVVGEGWHEHRGGPHAEAIALAAADGAARGATAYVTLEPCAHVGLTPPCTDALLAAGVARVVSAVEEPWLPAAGGAALLREHGVEVTFGPLEAEARRQNRVFFHTVTTGRPFVVLKAAVSLDGRIAAADGTSQWITGPEARRRAHQLRAEADAVLVGSGTVLADDPRLTVRLPGYAGPQPLRVVLDGRGRVPATARVRDDAAPVLVVTEADGLDLHGVLARLWERGVRSLLVEGGATVAGSFLRADLVDELRCHVAPIVLGEKGLPLVVGDGVTTLMQAHRFRLLELERAGDDALLTLGRNA
jgi:diaminohydroxyphosphoribosylaminopyrimidine deaminase / 5-amino-6-(5-phosphoribosylamino)uracil reductase